MLSRNYDKWCFGYFALVLAISLISLLGIYHPSMLLHLVMFFWIAFVPALTILGIGFWKYGDEKVWLVFSAITLFISLAFHPSVQPYYLGKIDAELGNLLYKRSVENGIVGQSRKNAIDVLGQPFFITKKNSNLSPSKGYLKPDYEDYFVLEYYPLPFFWAGSTLQVLVENDIVTHIEID